MSSIKGSYFSFYSESLISFSITCTRVIKFFSKLIQPTIVKQESVPKEAWDMSPVIQLLAGKFCNINFYGQLHQNI